MMKGSKCLLLLAALLVGFGLTKTADAQSALIQSVSIVSPDSGTVRGIDSTFVATASILDYTASDSIEVIMYLIQGNVDTAGVADGTQTDLRSRFNSISGRTLLPASNQVSVNAKKRGTSTGADTLKVGNGDSVVVSVSNEVTTFTWYGRIDSTAGTVNGVSVAAIAVDYNTGSANDTTTVKTSATSKTFNIDADRPANPTSIVSVNAGALATANVGGSSKSIAGIGDTINVRTKLGATTVGVLQGDSLSVLLNIFGKNFAVDKAARSSDTLKTLITLAEGTFGDLDGSANTTATVYLVDKAGNLSGGLDTAPQGATKAASFIFDTKAPVLDGLATGDTILPVSNDTVTDGTINSGVANDINPITYGLGEALDSLFVTFTGPVTVNVAIAGGATDAASSPLTKTTQRVLDLSSRANGAKDSTVVVRDLAGTSLGSFTGAYADSVMSTGVYSVAFKGKDLAGNVGPVLTRTDVYIDVDDVKFERLFPTKASFGDVNAARVDTLDEETSKLVFKLSEPVDSLLITYKSVSGPDHPSSGNKLRTRRLTGSQLTNTASEQLIPVDSLVHGTKYELTVLARDLAGNFTRTRQDTFFYDTSFVVPVLKRFVVTASQRGPGSPVNAGAGVTVTLKADATTDGTRDAVTYKRPAILKVANQNGGVKVEGNGVTKLDDSRWQLNDLDWVTGIRTVTVTDTTSTDELTISIVDSASAGGPYTGALDSVIVIQPDVYSKLVATAPAVVGVGQDFNISVSKQDKFGNVRVADSGDAIASDHDGLDVAIGGDAIIQKGLDTVVARISRARDAWISLTVAGLSDTVMVTAAPGGAPLDGPDQLVGEDYMGADGMGDQGGFVMMTWDLSDDHGSVDAYRIYRQIQVTADLDSTGAVVMLAEPQAAWVPWAKVDAVPGEGVGRAIVATLDNVATYWAIAAERGNQSTDAVINSKAVSTEAMDAYAAMAQTIQQSQQVAAMGDQPVFASLLPEALSFAQQGVAPRLKSVDEGVMRSAMAETKVAVRAIDNIAPLAVPYLRVLDTPGDAGSSITLTWTKSEDDRMLARSASNATSLGSVSDLVAGVKGYNIYRKVGATGEYALVGKASSGSTSFVDQTALNGVRYTYSVAPYDEDNVTKSDVERTAMAIRNTVVDKNGKAVYGLFGADNQVGFDDFFIFADNFGLTAADEAFEPAFDLASSAGLPRVDFDDFFVFADNFGRGIEAAGKVVPMQAGLNADARLYLEASAELPRVGEEVAIDVDLADYVQLKGYGLSVVYDADKLEYVRTVTTNSLLGEGELATPRAITQTEGQVDIAAYGETVSEGALGMSVIFRTKSEIENTYVEVTDSQVRDGDFAVNTVALPAPVQIQTRPEAFALANNYPNPFNPATTIKYALPEASQVRLEVFNVVGQVVSTLVDNHQNAGRYVVQWDATNDQGHSLSSGIYFYRLQAGGEFLEVKKMLLLK
jgi:hypothetical protein